ncbi:MAG: type II toxin-antitoxin system VapC family toxin [Mesorhizobium sp.]|uniref:type II toxin-antitoxin system VapC family toxin n=1 Tax=Mesorhizobium sp. TaxID=1871066 RepID=UPI001221563A|nr:type II toxin-antitoxin system VapC family toxin [Mesorhizobium sp.]TIP71674.1 MAG: type II toxin-antitoxin system VapC family toxin [Mesorhizobium sp.]TIQ08490.1 MAG: type II toxin-antitoxin system VapC family toxin [Mesorhizobium sp.]TIR49474.1 MAG: type II toxin-antitoxin system VapC family toxin [Mesorhizobium sp.]TJV96077.1 MAG: type II toxin-antitoxin system VapC family toxin [Mesorhizobium sp.]
MNGYLLDTSVLSILAPDRAARSPDFQAWLSRVGRRHTWYVPAIAAAEVQKDIAKLRRAGGIDRAERLERWLDNLLVEFDERVLSIGSAIARRAGEMDDAAIARGRSPGLPDILIAATALEHDLTILTANNRHFEALEVANLNPFGAEPKA